MFKLLVYYFDEYQNEENEKAMSRGDQKNVLATLVSTEAVFGRHPIINFTTATTVTLLYG